MKSILSAVLIGLGLGLGLGLALPTQAAVTANSFITPQIPGVGTVQFTSGSPENSSVTAYTAGANGARCNAAFATTDDTVAHFSFLQIFSTGGLRRISIAVTVAAQTGQGTPSQPLIGPSITTGLPVDQYGNQYITLAAGDVLKFAFDTPIGSGHFLWMSAMCDDY